MYRCSSWTLIVYHYVLLVQYFCQWLVGKKLISLNFEKLS